MIQTAGKVSGVQMMLLPVSDMAQSIRFYGELLGMSVDQDDDHCVMLRAGTGSSIMLHGPESAPLPGSAEIWLSADGLDALGERLRAAGTTIEGPQDQSWGERMIATSDPDGYHIYLVEPRSGK